jgi:hypothetical protein
VVSFKQFVDFQGFPGGLLQMSLVFVDLSHLETRPGEVRRYFEQLLGAVVCQIKPARE